MQKTLESHWGYTYDLIEMIDWMTRCVTGLRGTLQYVLIIFLILFSSWLITQWKVFKRKYSM